MPSLSAVIYCIVLLRVRKKIFTLEMCIRNPNYVDPHHATPKSTSLSLIEPNWQAFGVDGTLTAKNPQNYTLNITILAFIFLANSLKTYPLIYCTQCVCAE